MNGDAPDTVIVICDVETQAARIMSHFYDLGIPAIGPVATTGMALVLAAQSQPTLALIASAPTGRRGAQDLARILKQTWNIGSVILGPAEAGAANEEWAPHPHQLARLSSVLRDLDATEGAAA